MDLGLFTNNKIDCLDWIYTVGRSNYRGIKMLSQCMKIWESLVQARLRQVAISKQQCPVLIYGL